MRAPCLVFLICIFSSQSLYLSANALPRSIASRPAFDCVSSHVRSCLVPRSLKGIGTVARRSVQKSLSSLCGQSGCGADASAFAVCTPKTRCFRFCSSPVFSCRAMKLLDSNEIQQLRDVSVFEINGMEVFM